ncbi:epoxide hydrolase family protein [Mesorhizobium muleiense]|uniref:epoxide hydrolase family protein n=1 Tax=Mesorhizobium muleiense TaxID=1004279 RepID=UPI003AFB47BD
MRRVGRVHFDDESWADGANLQFMQRLSHHWLHNFDWRAQEERLNRLPQFIATIDEADVHVVHQRGTGPSPMPIVLTHGWPGSFAEMEHIIPLLADPGAHGGDPTDAFHVVVPSLPGYGFSPAPSYPGVSARTIAQLWHRLMEGLGYNRFAAQGGDIGAGVSAWLARQFPDSLAGVHVNYIPGSFRPTLGPASPPVTNEEQEFLKRVSSWAADEGAYAALQGTKPQTLAFSLTDSPVGLAAWIVEKFNPGAIAMVISSAFSPWIRCLPIFLFTGSATASAPPCGCTRRIAFARSRSTLMSA